MTSWDQSEPITVGVDGSIPGLRALDWATTEARQVACPLRLVHAYQPATNRAPGLPASTRIVAYENGQRILEAARHHLVTGGYSDLEVAYVLYEGAPAKALLDEALRSQSRALVVGSRGLGFFTTIAVGSTSLACAARAPLPVVVVPRDWTTGQHRNGRVIAGVAGHAGCCESALGYAFDFAQRYRHELVAITCWEPDNPYAREASTRTEGLRSGEAEADLRLDSALSAWRDKYPAVHVRAAAVRTPPVDALVEQSRDAELVVIGAHPRGRVRGRLLGSVARGLLRHSEAPVAIVHG